MTEQPTAFLFASLVKWGGLLHLRDDDVINLDLAKLSTCMTLLGYIAAVAHGSGQWGMRSLGY